ncbi:MAG: tRNA 2-thiouridine(34) synthase MnmA, partial [Chloroflexota bacterium]|nr:tRNA 2-thiouridine(34) synthase MnmA [Chloroflexota bacterium]
MTEKIMVGMSGGVDSAVAAALLLAAGFEVWGVTLQLWQAPQVESPNSLDDVRALAAALHIPLRVLDLRERFYQQVVERFAAAYAHGLTPNPCVTCNPQLKFDALLAAATETNAQWIATGHYARVEHPPTGPARLLRARSRQRDQSYMLYRLTQRHLTRLRCPLGELENKSQVREIARRLDLPHAEQRDSQDLCFLGGADYRPLLQTLRPESFHPGPILNEAGEVLGKHRGLPRYTIGQRSGLGIAAAQRLYVLALRPAENALIVGPAERLLQDSCQLTDFTFTQ